MSRPLQPDAGRSPCGREPHAGRSPAGRGWSPCAGRSPCAARSPAPRSADASPTLHRRRQTQADADGRQPHAAQTRADADGRQPDAGRTRTDADGRQPHTGRTPALHKPHADGRWPDASPTLGADADGRRAARQPHTSPTQTATGQTRARRRADTDRRPADASPTPGGRQPPHQPRADGRRAETGRLLGDGWRSERLDSIGERTCRVDRSARWISRVGWVACAGG